MRRTTCAAGAAFLIVSTPVLAFFSGGYFDESRLVAALVAWSLVALAALVAPRPLPRSTSGRLALAGLGLLAVWTLISTAWAPIQGRAEDDAQRVVLYFGVFAAAIALFDQRWLRSWLEPLIALGALVVLGFGLSERLLPGLVQLDSSVTSEGRLEQPLTYWNAEGALAAIGLLLMIRVAGDSRRPRAVRAAAGGGGVVLALAVYLSFSRGALAALAAGLLMILAFAPAVREQLRAAGAVLGAGVVAALVASALPTIRSLERGADGDPVEGAIMLATLIALALAAALLGVGRGGRAQTTGGRPRPPAAQRRLVGALAAIAVLGGVFAVVVLEERPKTVSPTGSADASRLKSIDSNRYRYWDVALDMFADTPVAGQGSGAFFVEWRRERDRVDRAADAHSLYLETFAELGVVGIVLLFAFMTGVAVSGRRLLRSDPAAATGPLAACGAWAVHAGLDWDWEMPAVTLPVLLLAAAAIAWSDMPSPQGRAIC